MVVATEVVARKYLDVATGTPISVDIPCYEAGDVYVYYGNASQLAVQGTDYTVELAGDFETFTVTPQATLLSKINALIANDATEENYITVRRTLDYLTDATPAGVRYTPYTSREFDRAVMRDQQLFESASRAFRLPASYVGSGQLELTPQADKLIGFDSAGDIALFGKAATMADGDTAVFDNVSYLKSDATERSNGDKVIAGGVLYVASASGDVQDANGQWYTIIAPGNRYDVSMWGEDQDALHAALAAVPNGGTLTASGTFNISKATGKWTDIYGTDGRSVSSLTLNGAQPCLLLNSKQNVTLDFSGATFVVDVHGQGGLDMLDCTGCVVKHAGTWRTAPYLAVGYTGGATGLFPPIDGTTGYAEKGGYVSNNYQGFNTTTLSPDIGGMRNNAVVTEGLSSGGYGGAFPQDDGTTAATWGSWRGGQIGNYGAAITIIGGEDCAILGGDIAGFNGPAIEVGLIRTKDMASGLSRINNAVNEAYAPKNLTLAWLTIKHCYIGGIQRNMHRGMTIIGVTIDGEPGSTDTVLGHPDASLSHRRRGDNIIAIDPGYGISSGRYMPQYQTTIRDCRLWGCARKCIDAHSGAADMVVGNRGSAKYFAVNIAIDETLFDTTLDVYKDWTAEFTFRDNDFLSGYRGIDFANGAFGRGYRERAGLAWIRGHFLIDGNTIRAPWGWYYTYGHAGFRITNNTFTFANPDGLALADIGNATGITHGALGAGATERGPVIGDLIEGNTVQNGPDGNFVYAAYVYRMVGATFRGNKINVTPWTTGAFGKDYEGADCIRSGIASSPFGIATGYYPENCDISKNLVWNDITGARGYFEMLGNQSPAVRVSRPWRSTGAVFATSGTQDSGVAAVWVKRDQAAAWPGAARPSIVDVELAWSVDGAAGHIIDALFRCYVAEDGSSVNAVAVRNNTDIPGLTFSFYLGSEFSTAGRKARILYLSAVSGSPIASGLLPNPADFAITVSWSGEDVLEAATFVWDRQ